MVTPSVPTRQIVDSGGAVVGFDGPVFSAATDIEGLGNLTVGVAQVAITFVGTTKAISLRALPTNSNPIFIGKTGVQSDGSLHMWVLYPGDPLDINYDDSQNGLYAISDAAAQKLSVGALLEG